MSIIFLASLVLSASLKITDLDQRAWEQEKHQIKQQTQENQDITRADMEEYQQKHHNEHHAVNYRHMKDMTAEERDTHLQKVRLQMQSAFAKNAGEKKTEKNSLLQLKTMKKKAALKDARSLKKVSKPELKKEMGAGVSLLQQAERAEMMEKLAAYKVQVDFQVALDKKVNEQLLKKQTQRAASLMQMDVSQMTPTDRKEMGLMSEAELKMYAKEEARMNELLKDENAARKQIKDAQKAIFLQVQDDIKASPHYLRRIVSVEDMMYLIDTFGGPTLKAAAKEVSMLQTSRQTEEPEEAELEVDESQNKMMEKMNMAASVAGNVNRLANSDWAKIINANLGHPVRKAKFAGEAMGEFNHKMDKNRAKMAEKKKAKRAAEAEAQA